MKNKCKYKVTVSGYGCCYHGFKLATADEVFNEWAGGFRIVKLTDNGRKTRQYFPL